MANIIQKAAGKISSAVSNIRTSAATKKAQAGIEAAIKEGGAKQLTNSLDALATSAKAAVQKSGKKISNVASAIKTPKASSLTSTAIENLSCADKLRAEAFARTVVQEGGKKFAKVPEKAVANVADSVASAVKTSKASSTISKTLKTSVENLNFADQIRVKEFAKEGIKIGDSANEAIKGALEAVKATGEQSGKSAFISAGVFEQVPTTKTETLKRLKEKYTPEQLAAFRQSKEMAALDKLIKF